MCSTCAEFFETLEHQRLDLLNRTAVNKQTVIRFAAQHSIAWHFFPDWLRQIELQFGPVSTRMRAENLTECVNSFTEQEVNFLLAYYVVDAAFSHGFAAEVESLVVGEDILVPVCAPDDQGCPVFDCNSKKLLPLISYGQASPLGDLFERHVRPKLLSENIQLISENPMSSTLLNWTLKGVGVCWLPQRLVRAEISNKHLVLAGGRDLCVDLNISLFSHSNARFGLVQEVWRHLFAAQQA